MPRPARVGGSMSSTAIGVGAAAADLAPGVTTAPSVFSTFASSFAEDVAAAGTEISRLGQEASELLSGNIMSSPWIAGVESSCHSPGGFSSHLSLVETHHGPPSASFSSGASAALVDAPALATTYSVADTATAPPSGLTASQQLIQQLETLTDTQRRCQYEISRNTGALEQVVAGQLHLMQQQRRLEKKMHLLAMHQGFIANQICASVGRSSASNDASEDSASETPPVQGQQAAENSSSPEKLQLSSLAVKLDSIDALDDSAFEEGDDPNRAIRQLEALLPSKSALTTADGHAIAYGEGAPAKASRWSCAKKPTLCNMSEVLVCCKENPVCYGQGDAQQEAALYRSAGMNEAEGDAADFMLRRSPSIDSMANQCNVRVSTAVSSLFGRRRSSRSASPKVKKAKASARSDSDGKADVAEKDRLKGQDGASAPPEEMTGSIPTRSRRATEPAKDTCASSSCSVGPLGNASTSASSNTSPSRPVSTETGIVLGLPAGRAMVRPKRGFVPLAAPSSARSSAGAPEVLVGKSRSRDAQKMADAAPASATPTVAETSSEQARPTVADAVAIVTACSAKEITSLEEAGTAEEELRAASLAKEEAHSESPAAVRAPQHDAPNEDHVHHGELQADATVSGRGTAGPDVAASSGAAEGGEPTPGTQASQAAPNVDCLADHAQAVSLSESAMEPAASAG